MFLLILLFTTLGTTNAFDEVQNFRFAVASGSNSILAASPKQAMVWGFAPDGATVVVSFGKHTNLPTTVGPDQADGKLTTFRVLLPVTIASFDKYNITATCTHGCGTTSTTSIISTNVMFGEVWVCSGQSNMGYPLGSSTCWNASNTDCKVNDLQCSYGCVENAGQEIQAMRGYDAGMRLLHVPKHSSDVPIADIADTTTTWLTPSEEGGGFSAACWFFGRDIYQKLNAKLKTTPVGLIQTTWGGTPDQHWSSPAALSVCTQGHNGRNESWLFPKGYKDSVLWNGQVVPLTRTVHSGAVWYQGEANAGQDGRTYNCSFPAMIRDWRKQWRENTDGGTSETFPFGWVQLNSVNAACKYGDEEYDMSNNDDDKDFNVWLGRGFPDLRLAQSNTLSVIDTFQAVVLDTPVASGSIHSPYKQPVGARLARGALRLAYGMEEVDDVRPFVQSAVLATSGTSLRMTVGGLGGVKGMLANIADGALGFEVLGNVSWSKTGVGWASTPVVAGSSNGTTIVVGNLPAAPRAVRYLWYSTPCGMVPFECPVSANVIQLGPESGETEIKMMLPPFVMGLTKVE